MVIFLYFVVLLYLTDSALAECNVTNCDPNFCNGTDCSKCQGGYYKTGNGNCNQCLLNCKTCDGNLCYKCNHESCDACISNCTCVSDNVVCPACPDGYNKSSSASSMCFKCHFSECKCSIWANCIGCLPGKYGTSNHCQNSCPSNCVTCKSSNDCTKCIASKYGQSCQLNCTTVCDDGTCDKISGLCVGGCADGQYLHTNNECRPCRARCVSCIDYNTCISCKMKQYWGQACQLDCTGCYEHCNKTVGCTSECDVPYYKVNDKTNNGYVCIRCPENCATCGSSTQCNTCKSGRWGSTCQHQCTGCSKCDKSNGCDAGCSVGYIQKMTSSGLQCFKCPDKCENCFSDTNCDKCVDGYYFLNTKCVSCSDTCKDNTCSQYNGSCSDGCIAGWFGQRCDKKCPPACELCEQFNSSCIICRIGFYGNACESNCSTHCITMDGEQTCQKNDGTCKFGCEDGYWGNDCSNPCQSGCNASACSETTGECFNGCNERYYGSRCENECSPQCKTESQTLRQCHETDGGCHFGCQVGWFGPNCTSKCVNCKQSVCFQQNGTCILGCVDGFTGEDCFKGSHVNPLSNENESGSQIAGPVGAAAGAVVVIALVIVAIVLFLRRRRATRKREPQEDSISLEIANDKLSKGENTYATMNDSKTQDTPDILSEAVIFSEDSSVVMSKAPNTVAANTVTVMLAQTAEKETEKVLSNQETLPNKFPDLETEPNIVPEKEKQIIKKDSSALKLEQEDTNEDVTPDEESKEQQTKYDVDEDGNTYYNTVGKHIPVSGLAEYIKTKDNDAIIEEFYKLPRGLLKDYNTARSQRNAIKNRYKQIYPYDVSRVILKDGGNDYVNASFIQGYNRPKEYIGSSGPFKRGNSNIETVSDFWRMVWQENCKSIVMLTNCYENTQHKCEQYWPELGNSVEYANLNVTCVTEDEYADFTIRSFVVTQDGKTLNTRHLHFTVWPDKGVPTDVTSMIEYIQKVRSLHKDKTCPMIVHCSAGIGRTGTFIALDMLTFMGEARGYVDIFGCVTNLRYERANLVQTPEQYEYLHHAILHALTFDCKGITAERFIETYSRMIKNKDGKSHIEAQFQKLQSTLDKMSAEDQTAMDRNGALTDKNRKGSDVPGDENRVRLHENRKPSASDYINAMYINGFRSRNRFIVAQTPLPTTLVDFLSLIFQVKCSCVVMMEETDLQDQTVGVFWPADNQVIKHGVFQVRCKESKTIQNYTLKKLSIMHQGGKNDEAQDVNLFIFTNWPRDAAVPKSSDSLLQLVKDVDTKNRRTDEERPIIIHCMTGAERSCLYCAVSVLIEKMEIEHEVSVVNTLRQIKARRRSAIPTLEQYKFCHQAVTSYLRTFDIYSNFGLKPSASRKTSSK